VHGDDYAKVNDVLENRLKDSKFTRIELAFCDAEDLEIPQKHNGKFPKHVLDSEAIYRLILNPERISDSIYELLT